MNILYLIGNGFDLNLEMATSYQSFYTHYTKQSSEHRLIKELKSELENEDKNWSDLEIKFGDHTQYLKSEEEFELVFEDIGNELRNYLMKVDSEFNFEGIEIKNLKRNFCSPEAFLPETAKQQLKNFKGKFHNNASWNIDIFTFNYTKSLEKLLQFNGEPIKLAEYSPNRPITLRSINHIHGDLSEILLGVNDRYQIANEKFRDNPNITEAFVKNECNLTLQHGVERQFINRINSAQLIVIFGSSLGDSDKMWWNIIARRLLSDCKLIIFEKCDNVDPHRMYKLLGKRKRERVQFFLDKSDLSTNEKQKVENNIYFAFNTRMFHATKVKDTSLDISNKKTIKPIAKQESIKN